MSNVVTHHKWGYYFKLTAIFIFAVLITAVFWPGKGIDQFQWINYNFTGITSTYFSLGFSHIIPFGLDHVLFLGSLFLLTPRLKSLFWQVTIFTLANLCGVLLSVFYSISSSIPIIIELSSIIVIFYISLENLFLKRPTASRFIIIILFGVIHGIGFTNILSQSGIQEPVTFNAVIMLNFGIEMAQLLIISTVCLLSREWFSEKPYFKKAVRVPSSLLITGIALYMALQLVFA